MVDVVAAVGKKSRKPRVNYSATADEVEFGIIQ
jgi:hypothetical protein